QAEEVRGPQLPVEGVTPGLLIALPHPPPSLLRIGSCDPRPGAQLLDGARVACRPDRGAAVIAREGDPQILVTGLVVVSHRDTVASRTRLDVGGCGRHGTEWRVWKAPTRTRRSPRYLLGDPAWAGLWSLGPA